MLVGCGATDQLDEARRTAGALTYGARIAGPLTEYGNAIIEVESDPAIAQGQVATVVAADIYRTSGTDIAGAAKTLQEIDPPDEVAADHRTLASSMARAGAALRQMDRHARAGRPVKLQRAAARLQRAEHDIEVAAQALVDGAGADLLPDGGLPGVTVPSEPPTPAS